MWVLTAAALLLVSLACCAAALHGVPAAPCRGQRAFARCHAPSLPLVPTCLQIVSCWANFLGGVFPLLSAHYGFNPAVTSAPLMVRLKARSIG